jgi:hypothetical protein
MSQCAAAAEEDRLVLRNAFSELVRLAPFVESYAHRRGLSSTMVFAVQLCLDEAVSNIIRQIGRAHV